MLAKVKTAALQGLDGYIVEVEVDLSPGLPSFTIVGLPDAAVQEARERVRAALRNSGAEFPMRRITVNLAPADVKKEGPSYDLPIAVGILLASGQAEARAEGSLFLGELSLDGSLRHTNGILPMVALGRGAGYGAVFVPQVNAEEAALVEGVEVLSANSLAEITAHLTGMAEIAPYRAGALPAHGGHEPAYEIDLAHIRGQEHAKRALEVAAAGGHNLLMSGPPGSGKTLLARALASILPTMTPQESLDVTKIYSVSGLLPEGVPLMRQRPFRSPHYTISNAGLVGGGRLPKPGEVTLSHRGVLFLDELPEFGHHLLETLRQPLEDKVVSISRAQGTATFPASFMLVGAMNPCPCGYYGDSQKACTCPSAVISRYQRRISGPLLDRIDLFAEVPRVDYEKLTGDYQGEASAQVRQRVERAREAQRRRFAELPLLCNAEMGPVEVWDFCQVEEAAKGLLQAAMQRLNLSARGFHRVLKVSRTIADLAGAATIGASHVGEALQYRPRGFEG